MKVSHITFSEIADLRNGVNYAVADQGAVVKIVGVGDFQSRTEMSSFDNLAQIRLRSKLSLDDELQDGDLLFVRSNGNKSLIGRCMVIRNPPEAVTFSGFTIRARLDKSRVLPDYIALVFQGSLNRHMTLAGGGNGNISNLNQALLMAMPVRLPSLEIQSILVGIISTWDTAIQKTEQLIGAKEQNYTGLVQRLIAVGSKSAAWRNVHIRDIAERIQRQRGGSEYPLLTISSASGFIRQEDRYSRYMAGESAKTYTLLRSGEFSYNKGNSKRYEFGCVFQLQSYEAALVPSVYVSFRLHESVCTAYMRHLFAADYLKPQLRALVKTGVRNNGLLNIRPDEFMGTTVPLPTHDKQIRIANVLDAARGEIEIMVEQLAALRTQKRGLMQKLLTGQWRLPIDNPVETTDDRS